MRGRARGRARGSISIRYPLCMCVYLCMYCTSSSINHPPRPPSHLAASGQKVVKNGLFA